MRIENTEVYGFKAALRSMRNPLNSWDRSDSVFHGLPCNFKSMDAPSDIGYENLLLARRLVRAGSEHSKFLRLIQVWATWTLPRYVWTEVDTYKVGMTRMSCSTMHKLGHKDLTVCDFQDGEVVPEALSTLNELGRLYRKTKDYDYVRQMKKILPEGFLQRADVNFNYEVALNLFNQRRNHRLHEWKFHDTIDSVSSEESICDWLYKLPYFSAFVE